MPAGSGGAPLDRRKTVAETTGKSQPRSGYAARCLIPGAPARRFSACGQSFALSLTGDQLARVKNASDERPGGARVAGTADYVRELHVRLASRGKEQRSDRGRPTAPSWRQIPSTERITRSDRR